MKSVYLIILINFFFSINCEGQKCDCKKNKNVLSENHNNNFCDTTFLKLSKGYLYYQYDCDSLWLTFQNIDSKFIIYTNENIILIPLMWRLGYNLIRETRKNIIFRYGCSSTALDCQYISINKLTGKSCKINKPKWYSIEKYF